MKFLSGFMSLELGLLGMMLTLTSMVTADTPFPDSPDIMNDFGIKIAHASRPMWHFGQSRFHPPCYPTSALLPDDTQHGVNPSSWPDASTGCVSPGPFGPGNPFPTYFTVTRCSPTEIRVVYSLYFQKDGFSNVLVAKGHMHDWERIVVVWTLNQGSNPPSWTRSRLYKSFHSGYMEDAWGSIQNTFDESNPSEQGGKGKDHAKIYVGWAKHAMFSQRLTTFNDRISQGCSREFRSADWWYMPKEADLVPAGKDSQMGMKMKGFYWGSATSGPWVVEEGVCAVKEGGYTFC